MAERLRPVTADEEYPPTRNDVINQILLTGESLTENFDRLRSHLNDIAPVRATLTVTETPPGFAPEEIRQQWIGITLPTRTYFHPREGVSVLAREALEALKESRPEAYDWWRGYYARQLPPNVDPEGFPECLSNVEFLVFDTFCGDMELA